MIAALGAARDEPSGAPDDGGHGENACNDP
jgi:hypothetical protein